MIRRNTLNIIFDSCVKALIMLALLNRTRTIVLANAKYVLLALLKGNYSYILAFD